MLGGGTVFPGWKKACTSSFLGSIVADFAIGAATSGVEVEVGLTGAETAGLAVEEVEVDDFEVA